MKTPKTEIKDQPGPVDLSQYSPGKFERGAGLFKEGLWLIASLLLFRLCPFSFSAPKRIVLGWFGARIGRNVTIKPQVKITFPWKLTTGDNVWLGEECWLLNLERITLGNNVCVSQRRLSLHGQSQLQALSTFDLITKPIQVGDGAWIGAGAWVGPGVEMGTGSVLAAGSVTTKNLESGGIYRGNPAVLVKPRVISDK